MPENPRIYRSLNAPGTPKAGDIQYNESNNRIEVYTGSAWGEVNFGTVRAQATTTTTLTATALTADSFTISAGWVSLNTATPAFYIPAAAGTITGAVASLANRVAIGYDTTNAKIMVRFGGSWFQTSALAIV